MMQYHLRRKLIISKHTFPLQLVYVTQNKQIATIISRTCGMVCSAKRTSNLEPRQTNIKAV